MDLARPFTAMAIQFIDNWLELKDDVKYQKVVLSCLRSLNSKVHLSDASNTEMKTQYNWKNDWQLAKPVRIDKAGEDLYVYKPNVEAIEKQKVREAKRLNKLKELESSDFAKTIHLYSDFKIKWVMILIWTLLRFFGILMYFEDWKWILLPLIYRFLKISILCVH